PSAQTVDENRSASLTAIAVNDPAQKGVTWSLAASGCAAAACGALSNQTVTSVTYTAPNPVTAGLSVSVVATSVADNTKSEAASLTVVPPPSISTTSPPAGVGGSAYTAMPQESGGVPVHGAPSIAPCPRGLLSGLMEQLRGPHALQGPRISPFGWLIRETRP